MCLWGDQKIKEKPGSGTQITEYAQKKMIDFFRMRVQTPLVYNGVLE